MSRTLDVLIVESRRGGGRFEVEELEAKGHRVHRCHDPGEAAFPCIGVIDPNGCPLEGPMDVALVVRQHIAPDPSFLEAGVACAIRAGIPVVESGSTVLDPYEPWLTSRVEATPLTEACEKAVQLAYEPIIRDVLRRCAPLLDALEIDPAKVACRLELVWPRLQVHLEVPAQVSRRTHESLAVRALEAVRNGRRSYDTVNVHVHEVPS